MKEGYLLKRKTEHGVVSPQELEKINQYTRRGIPGPGALRLFRGAVRQPGGPGF